MLFVAGCLASPRHSIPGYLAIALFAMLATLLAQSWIAVDAGVAPQSPVRFAPLLAVWGIACSEVAFANGELLSRRMSIRDGIAKLVLLLRSRGTPVQGAWLSRTKWYEEGQRQLAARTPRADSPRSPGR